jgi:hypothetical protein
MADAPCATCQTPVPGSALFCPNCGSRTGQGDSRLAAQAEADIPGRLARALGANYEVRRLLGEGGFAQVFEVWDKGLERRLAVKVLKPDLAWSAGMLERFKQETRSIARLNHGNILAIHFVGEGDGLVYYAMPFVEGESLANLIRRLGALPPERALAIVRPLLEALDHAHQAGLVHRDIKPDNVMLEASTGRPLLVDFGIAKRIDGEGHKTQTGFVVGTPQYMSPEQALGQGDLDGRTDLYAMGAMLYQMVTGTPPFDGNTSQEIVGKHLSEPAPIATAKNARIPMWLSDVIVRCLAKRPDERFQSARALLDALTTGRSSGAQQSVSAERVVRQLQADAATTVLPSAEQPVGAATTPGATPTPAAPSPPPKRRGKMGRQLVLLLLAAGLTFGWLQLRRPVLVVENRLVEPIRVVVGNETVEVAPGASVEQKVRRRGPLVAQWYLVRPTGPSGPLGVEVQGSITVDQPRGRIERTITTRSAAEPVFAPLITNAADLPLGITVNAGTQRAMPCDCRVNPGATRARIGYYPLYRNSSVTATLGSATASFTDLGDKVDATNGTVGLRFAAENFPRRP